MSVRLRELIKNVRNCKTAADERAVVAKECANIRNAIREEAAEYRHRNVAKLLYIHMLGYPTHFGQMECLKLIASPSFSDKRVGYLGLMLLLDERQEVLMLSTHSLKSDLNHPNQYVVGLALSALANVSSLEIARDVSTDVQKLLSSSNPYIRKKAALCAVRIVRKVPETVENFVGRVKSLLTERNHGVLLTGVSLMYELCTISPSLVDEMRKLVPSLVRILKNLVMSGYAPDYDIQGITDPFLQIRILRLLRLLGKGNSEASDAMNDILAQVATNTESSRNVGNAILYECVQTIMTIESEAGLRVLAINILGRFLLNRDNNIRYVALNTLKSVVAKDMGAVQRHRNTIVDCLKDNDVSIRRRALDLLYALVNEENVRPLVKEMIKFMAVADSELRADLTAKICAVTERYATDKRWHIDTILRVMSMPGNYVDEKVQANLISLIMSTPSLQTYAVGKLYMALLQDTKQQTLVQVGVWCLGEFGELLLSAPIATKRQGTITVTEDSVLDLLSSLLKDINTISKTKEFILTALMKLSSRFKSEERIRRLIENYRSHMGVELQQRSCEYFNILKRPDSESLRTALLERMPAPEDVNYYQAAEQPAETVHLIDLAGPADGSIGGSGGLIGGGGGGGGSGGSGGGSGGLPLNLVQQLFEQHPIVTPSPIPIPTPTPDQASSLLNILAGSSVPITRDVYPPLTVLAKNGLTVTFHFAKQAPNVASTSITVVSTNSTTKPFTDFVFQAAVPKYISLLVDSPSGSTILPGGQVTQLLRLDNSMHGQKPLMLKIRVEYKIDGAVTTEEASITNFPAGL